MTQQQALLAIWNEAQTLNADDPDEAENGLRRIAELARAALDTHEPAEWALPTL